MSGLRLFHTSDVHGTTAVYEALKGRLETNTDILLDSGDTLLGSNTAFRRNEPNLERLRSLGCAAMTMGNRELHYLHWVLEQRAAQRGFPLLAANLVDLWGRPQTWEEGVSLERQGVRIGVFGLTVVQYPVGSLYEKFLGLRFLPPETLIDHLVERYQAEHDVVIFLSHLGLDQDRILAQRLALRPSLKLDLILGGHTHVRFREPEKYGNTWLSHIGSHSSGYGIWTRNASKRWSHRFEPVSLKEGLDGVESSR